MGMAQAGQHLRSPGWFRILNVEDVTYLVMIMVKIKAF